MTDTVSVDAKTKTEKQISLPIRKISTAKKSFLVGLLIILLLLPLLNFVVPGFNYWLFMILYTLMYIAMASSWNIIGGYAGYTSLGHNVFFAVGAYFAGILLAFYGVSPFITAIFAGISALILGFIFGLISLRTRGPAFIISTIALVMMLKIALDNWQYVDGTRGLALPYLDLPYEVVKIPFYFAMLAIAIGAVLLSYKIRHSKFGLGLRAISQDETKAEVAGIPTNYYKILAFALSGLFIGIAGALWGYYNAYVKPSTFLSILIAAQLVLMSVLGGKGTVSGPIIGTIIFIGLNEFFLAKLGSSDLNIVATGLLLIAVLLFFPKGIVGTLKEHGKLPGFLDWD